MQLYANEARKQHSNMLFHQLISAGCGHFLDLLIRNFHEVNLARTSHGRFVFHVSKLQAVNQVQPVTAPLNLSMQRTERPCGKLYPTWFESHVCIHDIFWASATAKLAHDKKLLTCMQQTISSAKQIP